MLIKEFLKSHHEIIFSEKFDTIRLKKEKNTIFLNKIRTAKIAKLYFLAFLLFLIAIGFFSDSIIIIGLCILILISMSYTLFLQYSVTIHLDKKEIEIKNHFLFIIKNKTIAISKVLDWIIKDGEVGFNVFIKTGDTSNLINRFINNKKICRFNKQDEASDFVYWIKEITGLK